RVAANGFMSLRCCNSDTRAKVLTAESSRACVWFATRRRVTEATSQESFEHLLYAADPEGEPQRSELGSAGFVEIAWHPYIGPAARREARHGERDRDREVIRLGHAEHRHRERAVAGGERGIGQPRMLVAEQDDERGSNVDVVDGCAGIGAG